MKYFCRITFLCCTLNFIILSETNAQNFPKPQNLVLEGAGIRGVAYTGALEEMQNYCLLDSLKRIAGTSAGAIVATALALGYSTNEINEVVFGTDFQRFNDGSFFMTGNIYRFYNNFGWFKGDAFNYWLGLLIEAKTGNADLTFAELHSLKKPDLFVTATSLNNQKTLIFSYLTYPNMKIRDAIRASMSVPFYFAALRIDASGNVLKNNEKDTEFDVVVDGGILSNFSIHLFDSKEFIEDSTSGLFLFHSYTIGLRIDSEEQIERDYGNGGLAALQINNLSGYMRAFYNISIEGLNRSQLTPADWQRTISISSAGIGPKVRHISEKEKLILIESGKKGVQHYILRHTVSP